jgi:small subunit ribosomal protein S16
MALKIRLSRIGATHNPIYHVVVAEARSRRDGAAVEILGTYTPRSKKEQLSLDVARAEYWLSKGALPTDTAKGLIKKARKNAPPAPAAPVEPAAPAAVEPAAAEPAAVAAET